MKDMTRNIKELGDRMTAMEEKIKEPTQIPKVLSSKIIFSKKYLSVPSLSVPAKEQRFITSTALSLRVVLQLSNIKYHLKTITSMTPLD